MTDPANPAPGFRRHPDHAIAVEPLGQTVTVTAEGITLARSDKALLLKEKSYPPVIYVPFDDIAFEHLARTSTTTHCPFKGDASYWRLAGRSDGGDVMWAYESPFDEMVDIGGHGAFDARKTEVLTG